MSREFTKGFKEYAVRYHEEHKDLGYEVCSKNLGISKTALYTWVKKARKNDGEVITSVQIIIKAMKQRKMPNCVKN